MANIMNLVKLKNTPSRNGFDLSRKRNFTAKVGELLPALVLPIIPGDYVTIDVAAMTRTAPLNTSAFARVREYYDFYFVPYQLLWNKSNTVLSQMNYNKQHATGLFFDNTPLSDELPHLSTIDIANYVNDMIGQTTGFGLNYFGFNRGKQTVKLLEYLDYGTYLTSSGEPGENVTYPVDVNLMALLAYQKIYADFYRDEQWESPNPSSFNLDFLSGLTDNSVTLPAFNATTPDPFYSDYNMFDLRYCNWQKDLYHGLLPSPQYGETAVVPINGGGGSASGDISFTIPQQNVTFDQFSAVDAIGRNSSEGFAVFFADPSTSAYVKSPNGDLYIKDSATGSDLTKLRPNASVPSQNITAKINSSTSAAGDGGLSILALRQYEFLQKYKEIQQSNDQDYKAQIKAIWGVDVQNALSEKCTYLGGVSSSLDINEVVNTNLTGDNAANIQGKGISVANGKISFKSDGQFGVIMCIYHALPIVDYTANVIDHQHLQVNAADFPNPVFDRVGMEAVTAIGLDMQVMDAGRPQPGPNATVLGYAPRYINYKTAIDTSVGAFKRSLSNWVLSYPFVLPDNAGDDVHLPAVVQDGALNYTFFKMSPHVVDPIFVLQADDSVDTDQFWISSFFDVKAVRNLDVNGLPY